MTFLRVDRMGTIELQTQNNGIVELPIYEDGAFGGRVIDDGTYEMLQVETLANYTGDAGFIPLVDPSEAAYPYVRVQTENHGVLAVNDNYENVDIIDSFEDGDLSEYSPPSDSGQGENRDVQSGGFAGPPPDGDKYMYNTSNTIYPDGGILSASGLDNYFSYPGTLRVAVYITGNGAPAFGFAVPDTLNDNASFRVEIPGNGASGFELEDGGATLGDAFLEVGSGFDKIDANEWYEIEIRWGTGDYVIEAELFNETHNSEAVVSSNDSQYQSHTGIGFVSSVDSAKDVAWDYVRTYE